MIKNKLKVTGMYIFTTIIIFVMLVFNIGNTIGSYEYIYDEHKTTIYNKNQDSVEISKGENEKTLKKFKKKTDELGTAQLYLYIDFIFFIIPTIIVLIILITTYLDKEKIKITMKEKSVLTSLIVVAIIIGDKLNTSRLIDFVILTLLFYVLNLYSYKKYEKKDQRKKYLWVIIILTILIMQPLYNTNIIENIKIIKNNNYELSILFDQILESGNK